RANVSYWFSGGSPLTVHRPPSPRKVGMPESLDIPAPARTTVCAAPARIAAASAMASRNPGSRAAPAVESFGEVTGASYRADRDTGRGLARPPRLPVTARAWGEGLP